MGKKKQIRNLELEVERLRKSVYDRENAIDKLLSDTITDDEKNFIKFDRQFARMVQKEFDRNILVGRSSLVGLTATPIRNNESIKVGDFFPYEGPVKDVVDHLDKLSDKEVKENRDKLLNNMNLHDKIKEHCDTFHFGKTETKSETVAFQTQGRHYRHTEEGDKVFGELLEKPVTLHKVPQDELEMVTIQVPVGSFVLPPKDSKELIIKEFKSILRKYPDYLRAWKDNIAMMFKDHYHWAFESGTVDIHKVANDAATDFLGIILRKPCDVIAETEKLYYDINPDSTMDVPSYFYETVEKWHKEWQEVDTELSLRDWCLENKSRGNKEPKQYVEFKINHGDNFVKEVEYNGDGNIKTTITYPDADGAPKTIAEIHDDVNLMETIVKMPGCSFQKSELFDGGQNNQGTGFITNPIEQEFRLKNHKDIATFEQYEKYIFLSDYQLPSLYINQDIVIKEGTIISLLEGGSYGMDAVSLIRFPYQNIKTFEEKGLVRRLSPLEMCGEPQQCAPAKED